jgi:pimeloyl-ACP methyl ester carboxylesterase
MDQEIIHVYLMPGMAASPLIFEYIKLPKKQFVLHTLDWILPLDKEPIGAYAKRLAKGIKQKHVVLIGVSFGGFIVQEMSKHLKLKKLIIISSIKSRKELPRRMKLASYTKTYKLLPTRLASKLDTLAKYAFGKPLIRRLNLYQRYMGFSDHKYLDWAIEEMVSWQQREEIPNIVHIHGTKDHIFPIKNIEKCIEIRDGTHIMILTKYKWFNKNLPSIILAN